MATNWIENDKLMVDLDYWVIKEKENDSTELIGVIQFDIRCRKLKIGESQKSVKEIEKILLSKCKPLLEDLKRKHHLKIDELSDMIANVLRQHNVNVETIESDADRKNRLSNTKLRRKTFFDKISIEL